MTIERYVGVLIVLAVGLFLAHLSAPEAALAKVDTSTGSTCVQCYQPVNSWCAPATAGAATTTEKVCTTYAPCPPASPCSLVGSILELPFALVRSIFGGCP
jgi:hypothetical protein